MSSRKIEDLTPTMQTKYWLFDAKMKAAGIPYVVTCTARDISEQKALYAQGRETLSIVNDLRKRAGMSPIDTKNNIKVTWTMNSKHIVNLGDNDPNNNKSRAFDIALTKDGKAHWDIKISVNKNDIPDYLEARKIGLSVGLKIIEKDLPHYEE